MEGSEERGRGREGTRETDMKPDVCIIPQIARSISFIPLPQCRVTFSPSPSPSVVTFFSPIIVPASSVRARGRADRNTQRLFVCLLLRALLPPSLPPPLPPLPDCSQSPIRLCRLQRCLPARPGPSRPRQSLGLSGFLCPRLSG